jgi:uncharacterized Zn finger protein (UPF0148 family)
MHTLHLAFYHLQTTKHFNHNGTTACAVCETPVLVAVDGKDSKPSSNDTAWNNLAGLFKNGNRKKQYAISGR